VILDRGHRKWLWFTVVTLLGSTVLYVLYVTNTPGGPRGGSGPGLAFGIAGTAFIYFAALLGLSSAQASAGGLDLPATEQDAGLGIVCGSAGALQLALGGRRSINKKR